MTHCYTNGLIAESQTKLKKSVQRGASLLRELILQLLDGLGQWMMLPSAAENFAVSIQ